MNELIKEVRRTWSLLVQFACWIAMAIGKFVPEPPLTTLTAPPDARLKHFAQFIATVLLGVLLVFCMKWRRKADRKPWVTVAMAVAVFTVGVFFAERGLRSAWTCDYSGTTITIGTTLTRDARDFRPKLGGKEQCGDFLAAYGGRPFDVWDRTESERHYLVLSILMVSIWLGAASCIVTVTQAIRCATASEGANLSPPDAEEAPRQEGS
jgi:hypothetical protein